MATNKQKQISIEKATDKDMECIFKITYETYYKKGYCNKSDDGKLRQYDHLNGIEETTAFIAKDKETNEIIGTCSTTIDGKNGIPADHDFKKYMDEIRSEDKKIAGSWRFSTSLDSGQKTNGIVAKLLLDKQVSFWHEQKIESCLISVAPNHENFYIRYFNCRTVARSDTLQDIQNTKAVLMRWDIERSLFKTKQEIK